MRKGAIAAIMAAVMAATSVSPALAQTDYSNWSDAALRAELNRKAVAETHIMMPMRDGVGLSTDIWRPRGNAKVPIIFDRTPYIMPPLAGGSLRQVLETIDRGYAYVRQNERGRYLSGGNYKILGYPQTDGYDALTWMAAQPWSSGKVGTLGCSSPAEWQLALAAMNHPAHAAMVPQAAGAGIGRVGDFHEQGNWYRGGVPRTLFAVWLYDTDHPVRAEFDPNMSPAERDRALTYYTIQPAKPAVPWARQVWRLPVSEWLSSLGEPPGTYQEFIEAKGPADPYWFGGGSGLYHDSMGWGVPSLFFNSWYDVSIGPNMALYNHVREKADADVRGDQYVVVGPNTHCAFAGLRPNFTSGDRALGDASFNAREEVWKFFDRYLKGEAARFPDTTPKVRYFSMGDNAWRASDTWPARTVTERRLYLRSDGRANSMYGDGKLSFTAPGAREASDTFVYDPRIPVQTIGGGDCCNGGVVNPGAYDQRPIELRHDVLVYTSDPLTEPLSVAGFVDAILYVSSSARDTDFVVKLVDVAPDGTAYILEDTILRARYRDGFDREVFMSPGNVYKLDFSPMTTANTFLPGHRIRVQIASSSFPKYMRNLNTGGRNEFEREGVVATNQVHHQGANASYIVLPVMGR